MTLPRLGPGTAIGAVLLLSAALGASCKQPRPPSQRLPMELLSAHPRQARAATTTGSIVGVVLGLDGKPLDFALVAAVNIADDPEEGKPPFLTTSIKRGKFELNGLLPGSYGLTVTAPAANGVRPTGDANAQAIPSGSFAGVVTVTPGEIGPPLVLRLGPPGIFLKGHVLDEKGNPLPDALIRAVRESSFEGDHFFARSDAQGLFSFAVPQGKYFVVGQGTGRQPVRIAFDIDAEHIPPDLELRLAPALQAPPREELDRWVTASGSTFKSVDSTTVTTDLTALNDIAGNARIIGLGEASYSGSELAKLKQRMFRYLVENQGVTVLLLEAGHGDARALDDYVHGGKGKLADALAGLGYFSLDSEEMAALFTWMRLYNEVPKHKKKLQVLGFDVQRTGASAGTLQAYLTKVDKAFSLTVETTLDRLHSNGFGHEFKTRPREEQDAALKVLESLGQHLDKNARIYTAKSSSAAYAQARGDVAALVWAMRVYRDENLRGIAMGDVAKRAIDGLPPGTRMALWAHNAQISKRKTDAGMGATLAEAYKTDYVAIGATFYQGWVRAWDFTTGPTVDRGTKLFRLAPAENGSLESVLDATGVSMFMADVRKAPPALAAWFAAPISMRSVGTTFVAERRSRTRVVVKEAFDALVFVKKQTTVMLTETGKRPGKTEWQ